MIRLTTGEGDHVWVGRDKVVLITQAMAASKTGPPMPVLGMSMVYLMGVPPISAKGSPETVAALFVGGGGGRNSLVSA